MQTRQSTFRLALGAALLSVTLAAAPAQAGDATTVRLTIKDHRFSPAEIRVPAGLPVTLIIRNDDATAEEIDSPPLKIEKIVPASHEATIVLRPLSPGTYDFKGEYHSDTATGQLVAD
jgi:plastocyanin